MSECKLEVQSEKSSDDDGGGGTGNRNMIFRPLVA